jgi:DNA topoisomerase-1
MTQQTTPDVHELYADLAQSAAVAGLRYLPDTRPGFGRKKGKNGFIFVDASGQKITDARHLERINKLVIPPAWTQVWISPSPNGHIQATGRDQKGRKQYLYHARWRSSRSMTKFSRMIAFGEKLPLLRARIQQDMDLKELNKTKITALVVHLLDNALIRVGNKYYAKLNKSFGLTTLRDKHVEISGSNIRFRFIGKKGIAHEIDIRDRRMAALVKKCKDIPGYDLFQYYDEAGNRCSLDSGDVNAYIQQISEADFTAKDFRTWGGTTLMVQCLEKLIDQEPEVKKEKTVKEALKQVARELGNTPSVCSKYYVHPQVVALFQEDKLFNYLKEHDAPAREDSYFSAAEKLVLNMLREISDQ